ncbi:MAG TPA: acetyl-CoA carboxylase [Streptosporangiaceae bacterium]|nr:acetyl-CoA carboxylase [Streptosporangiaceae bacterium]
MMAEKTIKCPLPGIFYRRPSPDADPFVTEGQKVTAGDVVGLVEIMKNFHEIRSADDGVIDRFLVGNEEAVEAEQDIAALRG